jgi:hypothetical protein
MNKSATKTTEPGGIVHPMVMPLSAGKLAAKFREELVKIMPGYNWTVHKSITVGYLEATGIQTSGYNRLSTLHVARRENIGRIVGVNYEVKSSGSGLRSPWLATCEGSTLAQALRSLQSHYENVAANYGCHGRYLQNARKKASA